MPQKKQQSRKFENSAGQSLDFFKKMAASSAQALQKTIRAVRGPSRPVVALLRLQGVIAPADRFQRGLSLEKIEEDLEKAFGLKGLSAVILQINSPGGSVVQSAQIADRIRFLADEKNIPVLAFADDLMASGGYMIALAADEIFAHPASMIGSIGVVMAGFGFSDLMARFGIERRLYTAGDRKAMLDPFSPLKPEDHARTDEFLQQIHGYFKDFVRKRRGSRLKGLKTRIFSGDVFLGEEALKLGLIDGLDDMKTLLKNRFGDTVKLREIGQKKSRFGGLLSFLGQRKSASIRLDTNSLITGLEEHSLWSRYGL